ncbi:MAG: ribonuclease P protein component [Candidatus Rokubacteria bacterium]|nr:ribonuclease P protein component [Candidatus Rokubacteria bacterium]
MSRHIRGAVKRNRVKRRLREAYRATRAVAPGKVALVIVGRPGALAVGFETLMGEMRQALGAIPGLRQGE